MTSQVEKTYRRLGKLAGMSANLLLDFRKQRLLRTSVKRKTDQTLWALVGYINVITLKISTKTLTLGRVGGVNAKEIQRNLLSSLSFVVALTLDHSVDLRARG